MTNSALPLLYYTFPRHIFNVERERGSFEEMMGVKSCKMKNLGARKGCPGG